MPLGERALNRPAAAKSQSAGREAGLQLVDALITTAAAMTSTTTVDEDEAEDAAGASSPMSLASDDGKLTAGMLSSSLLVLIEHLCHRAPERAEARATVVGSVEFILRRLPNDERCACAPVRCFWSAPGSHGSVGWWLPTHSQHSQHTHTHTPTRSRLDIDIITPCDIPLAITPITHRPTDPLQGSLQPVREQVLSLS